MRVDLYDTDPAAGEAVPRPYIGVLFECCGVYARIYRSAHARAYFGRCPRCQRPVRAQVGPTGTTQRIFRAT